MLTDEQALCAHQMSAILAPVKVLIATMEAFAYPTISLVKPYIGKMIDRLSLHKSTPTDYRSRKEIIKVRFYVVVQLVLMSLLFLLLHLIILLLRLTPFLMRLYVFASANYDVDTLSS